MGRYFVHRLLQLIPTLFIVSLIAFSTMRLVPGDPARLVAGPEASQEVVGRIRADLGLDKPIVAQYKDFIFGVLKLDLGKSVRSHEPVWRILIKRLRPTLELATVSVLFATLVGGITGILAATHKGSWFDMVNMVIALIGISMPSFWLGLLLIWLFSVTLRWLPTSGYGSLSHMVMPIITIGLQSTAVVARMVRASTIEVLREDYIRTARGKGVSPNRVVFKHALRNALIPSITVIGLQFGYLLAGSVVTETVFNWPGMGLLLINSIAQRDYPIVQGAILLFAVFFVFTSLAVDLCYAYIDPRIRYQ